MTLKPKWNAEAVKAYETGRGVKLVNTPHPHYEPLPRLELDSTGSAVVDHNYFWQPIATCPRGTKVQLLGTGGVAMYGTYNGKDTFYTHWAPLPKLQREKDNG